MNAILKPCDDFPLAQQLFREYAAALGADLEFQSFEAEIAGLPGDYAPPTGRLLIAYWYDEPAGCVALRPLEEGSCEMKRLWVQPAYSGRGIGRCLAETVIAQAREIGYHTMRLDTLARLAPALNLYRSLGFQQVNPYTHNPLEGALFMELRLDARGGT